MFRLGLREMILVGLVVCAIGFIILSALSRRPSIAELLARHDSQKEKRDLFTNEYFKGMAFKGVIEDIEDYVVMVPYRELRYRLTIKPEGKVRMPSSSPDTTQVYNFSNREKLVFTLGHNQGKGVDEDDIIIKKAGKPYFIVEEEDADEPDEIDTFLVSFRLFEPAEDLDPYVEAVVKRMKEKDEK